MYRIEPNKNTMQFETEDCQVFISCDKMQLFNELHGAIDTVLKRYYSPPTLDCADEPDDELYTQLKKHINGDDKE